MDALNVYALVAPAVLIMILAEIIYCVVRKNGYYSFQDSLMGMGTMIIAQCVNVAVAAFVLVVYGWIYNNWSITQLEPTLMNYVLCYIGTDFLFYWFHRAGHRVNILWAMHVPHHSAEELNYAVALRASFTQRAVSFLLFYWPLAVLGFSPEIIIPVVALNLVIQLIPHTRVIPKLPKWIDSWLNTPYHHQVHHAANPIYWDKNYGGTFIIWDKLFGSYSEQTEEVYYGVTIHPNSWDPTYLNFHWFIVLWQDMMAADHFIDKIQLWFRPPGWRPRNLPPYDKKPPVNAKAQIKFVTKALPGSTPYLVFQWAIGMGLMLMVVGNKSVFATNQKIWLSVLLWVMVTAWGGILSAKKWAMPLDIFRTSVMSVFLISYLPQYTSGIAAAGLVSLVWAAIVWFGKGEEAARALT